ncbi:MAG: peptidoglycan DD-metalloendopeptidase family protein [Actinomycetaceae bacterium]|nr:peptidoglycan DD-metalloendopeptidase family protein [Actinomycetaceae bacterium]
MQTRSLTKRLSIVGVMLAVVLALTLTGHTAASFGADRDDQVHKRDQARLEKEKAQSSLEGVNQELADTVLKLTQVKDDLDRAKTELASAEEDLQAHERKHDQLKNELEAAQRELKEISDSLAKKASDRQETERRIGTIVRKRYRDSTLSSPLALMISSTTTTDITTAAHSASTAARLQNNDLERLEIELADKRNQEDRQTALRDRVADLEAQEAAEVDAAQKIRQQKESAVHTYNDLKAQHEQAEANLENQKSSLQDDIAEQEKLQRDAEAEIAKIDEQNRRKAEEERKKQQALQAKNAAAAPSAGSGGMFIHPIAGPLWVTSPYGYRIHPVIGGRILHAGVDISSPTGQQQFATASGTVFFVGYEGTGGNTVKINHGYVNGHSWVTVHRHLSHFSVRSGQRVSQGQTIGLTGATGRVTGPHVHYEVWRDGTTINPMGLPGF